MDKNTMRKFLHTLVMMCAIFPVFQGSAVAAPVVRVMPDGIKTPTKHTAYAWAGEEITVWGNVTWDTSTTGTWEWELDGDGTYDLSGSVTNAKDITVNYTYIAAGTYFPNLRVTDGNGETATAQLRLDVLPADDGIASVNLAIERGLKWLYLQQAADGRWTTYAGYTASPTALTVLSFENRGHLPISGTSDIYRDTVVNGLTYLATQLRYSSDIGPQPAGDPDTHGIYPSAGIPDGHMVDLAYSGRSNYEQGMVMLAFAAAGPYNQGADPYDALLNPALNLTATIGRSEGGTITLRYYDLLAGMVDYVAWAQTDTGYGRGAWRYSGNNSGGDNSVAQWPAIGAEAAEGWGLFVPSFVKSEMLNYWVPATFSSITGGWGYTDTSYQTVSHAGAGMCILSWLGVPKTDSRMVQTLAWLDTNWIGGYYTGEGYYWYPWPLHMQGGYYTNYYAMYGIAKGARIARDATGNVSEISIIGSHDWYSEYTHHILHEQLTDGSWQTTMAGYHTSTLNTPWALLVLEQTISSLRPQAAIGATPNPVPPNTNITYDVSGSTHQDPAKYLVSWKIDFDVDDGVDWTHPDAQGLFPTSSVTKIGGFPDLDYDYHKTATVQVIDNVGETDEATVIVHIETGNVPPIADADGPYFGSVGSPITLDGSGSYDPDPGGTLVSYDWDLDGDGQYDDASGEIVQNIWNTPYTGYVGLQVCDNDGACSVGSAYTSITVSDLKPVSYTLQSYRRISRTVWEYTYQFTMENTGNGDATDVSASMQLAPAQVQIIDGDVTFGTIEAGQQVTAQDTFTIRIDRSVAVDNNDLLWTLTFTDSGGVVWKLVNFPLF